MSQATSQTEFSRLEIERQWRLWRSVIPASSSDADRRRTPYFYRRMAISFYRDARGFEWFPGQRETLTNLAKHYLTRYREVLAERRAS